MNNLHRIFVAINLPENVRKSLAMIQDRYLDLPARWASPQSLHITLIFLGNATDQETGDICVSAAEIAKKHGPFDIEINQIVYGPPEKNPPRMVWATGPKSAELGSLQNDLKNAFYEFNGCGGDNTEHFAGPHITLARIPQFEIKKMDPETVPQIKEQFDKIFMVETIEVMESELRRGGPVYTVLESVRLGGDS